MSQASANGDLFVRCTHFMRAVPGPAFTDMLANMATYRAEGHRDIREAACGGLWPTDGSGGEDITWDSALVTCPRCMDFVAEDARKRLGESSSGSRVGAPPFDYYEDEESDE